MKVVFVGQGPNRASWNEALLRARRRFNGEADQVEWAKDFCARIAITGSIGKKLADLGEWPCDLSFGGYARRNLNACWNGKDGKGDNFFRLEGEESATRILAEGFTHHVLLGAPVARCFGYAAAPLEVRIDKTTRKQFLLFPHPSGINQWWNDDFNRFRARKRLREFLNITNP